MSTNDGNGNMIIAWADNRNSITTGTDIYVQKINRDGTLPWGAEKLVCDAAGNQDNLSITDDGQGGAIIVWDDSRNNSSNKDIVGQKVNSDGSMAWTANGRILTVSTGNTVVKAIPSVAKISITEFVVVWRETRLTSPDLYIQKCLINTGLPQFSNDISIHGDQLNTQSLPTLVPDGSGNVCITWQDPRLGTINTNIYAQKVANDGSLLWGASGLEVCGAANNQISAKSVSDNAGGIVVSWVDNRNSNVSDIYAQRVLSNGSVSWTVDGVVICSATGSQTEPFIVNSVSDYIIIWGDPRVNTSDRNIYAQKISALGTALWSNTVNNEGVIVTAATGNQGVSGAEIRVVDSGSGTCIVTWADPRISTSDYNIYAQKLNSDGTAAYTTDGVLISSAVGNQRSPFLISDGLGGAIITWQDSRTSTNGEIYASRLYANGTLPVTYTSFTATKNTLNEVSLVWNIASEINTDEYLIERKGETGDFITIGSVKAQQLNTYSFIDKNPLLGNNYYRIKAKDFDATLSYSDVKTVQISALNSDVVSVYPNPTADRLNITISKAGNYQIKLVDQSGRVVLEKAIELNSGLNDLGVSLSSFSAGTYYLTLTNQLNYIAKKIIKI
ncbi:T9SS type A sorting domain-containing protein [Pedobacter glucosidilyticus]|uniref:T9SS type A sorting domain-containing protein n=1 Tax=Pedobacter glucosidilyticus TaxID=1122941 RepID=UPI00138ADC32|nr:T9SS type A sorting domain-containing protein [Pedobacter glucosidilyticus]